MSDPEDVATEKARAERVVERQQLLEQMTQAQDSKAYELLKHVNGSAVVSEDWEQFCDTVGLIGAEFNLVRKALFYQSLGLLCPRRISFNGITTDCRVNGLFVISSGRGKKPIRSFKFKVTQHFGKNFSEPASTHPEQYIGKMVWRKLRNDDIISFDGKMTVTSSNGTKLKTRGTKTDGKSKALKPEEVLDEAEGYLRDDEHLVEEGKPLLQGDRDENIQTFAILCKACDTIGENVVAKKLVDQKRDEGLSYCPTTQISICVQPFPIESELVLNGLFRRFQCIYPNLPEFVPSEDLKQRSGRATTKETENAFFQWLDDIDKWLSKTKEITMDTRLTDLFNEMVETIIKLAINYSKNTRFYASMMPYDCQNQLLRFAALRAVSFKHAIITENDLRLAYIDLVEFYCSEFHFLTTKIRGRLSYSEYGEGRSHERENALLQWLWLQGADSKQESQVSIAEALAYCCKAFDVSERTASREFEQLERTGQIGRLNAPGVSKIWLGQNFKIESIDDKMDFSLYDLCAARVASVSAVDKLPTVITTVITGATGATRATLGSELGICKNTSEKPKRPDFEVGAYV